MELHKILISLLVTAPLASVCMQEPYTCKRALAALALAGNKRDIADPENTQVLSMNRYINKKDVSFTARLANGKLIFANRHLSALLKENVDQFLVENNARHQLGQDYFPLFTYIFSCAVKNKHSY